MKKRILALLMAALLLMGLLSGCGNAALEAPTEERLAAARARFAEDETVVTINGQPVDWAQFYYLLVGELGNLLYYTGGQLPPDFSEPLTESETIGSYLSEIVQKKAAYYAYPSVRMQELGLQLSETEEADLAAYWQQMEETFGGAAALEEELRASYLNRDVFMALLRSNAGFNTLFLEQYGADGDKLPEEDVLAWSEENEYIHIKHILRNFKDADGNERDREELRAEMEELLAELTPLQGDKEALNTRFDELVAEKGEDPGMAAQPEGYTFTRGLMVAPFEEAAYGLELFGLSDIVETGYGYHILLRLPLEAGALTRDQSSGTGAYMTLRSAAATERFNTELSDWIGSAEVEWNGKFENLDYNELFRLVSTGEKVLIAMGVCAAGLIAAAVILRKKENAE